MRTPTLDPFIGLKHIRQGGLENEQPDLDAYLRHVIAESASYLMLDLTAEESILLHEILMELATQEGVNKPLGPQETMVDLLLRARVAEEDNRAHASILYRRAGDAGLLAAGGIGYIPKLMRGAGSAEKQRKLENSIERFMRSSPNQMEGGARAYYQGTSASAYRQASALGYKWNARVEPGASGATPLIFNLQGVNQMIAFAERQTRTQRMGAKRALLEEIARRVPILSDLLFFVKTLCIDGDLFLACQIADQSRRITGVLGHGTRSQDDEAN